MWETMLPDKYKGVPLLEKFKADIKEWVPECKCRLCKTYVAQVNSEIEPGYPFDSHP